MEIETAWSGQGGRWRGRGRATGSEQGAGEIVRLASKGRRGHGLEGGGMRRRKRRRRRRRHEKEKEEKEEEEDEEEP
jgi:hypothetical protein